MSHLRRLGPAWLLALLAATAALPGFGGESAEAQTSQSLVPGQAVRLSSAGVALRPLTDGRLASYGTEVDAQAVAFSGRAGSGSEAVTAAPGAELVVLHVVTSWDQGDTDSAVPFVHQVTLAVQSGTVNAPLTVQSDGYPTPDGAYFAAAVPAGGPALLTVSAAGLLPQTLDLRTDHRVAPSPTVMYRSAGSPAVTVNSAVVQSFTASAGDAGTASGQFGIATAFLSYWQPFSTTLASDPSKAFLDVEFSRSKLSIPGFSPSGVGPAGALPAGSVKFQLPNGRIVDATASVDPTQLTDIFSGDFYAEVPADITTLKVIVDVTSLPVQAGSNDGITTQDLQLHFSGPLSTELTLPPSFTPAPAANTYGSSPPPGVVAKRSASGGAPLIIVIVAVCAAVGLLGVVLAARGRRRHFVPARPVVWPPAQLPPATTLLLERGPAGALPPAPTGDQAPDVPPRVERAPAGSPDLFVRVLGALEVDGLVQPIRRRSVRRLLVALAVTPERALSADELAMIISDHPDRDPKATSVNSYASILRRSLPAGTLPDAGGDGYRLDPARVAVDWNAVSSLAAQPDDTPGWAEQAAAALDLVRGRPLEGGGWEGIEPAVRAMSARVEELARRLAHVLLAGDDPAGAERAVARGLAAVPGSVGLWEDRLDAAAVGSGYGLERAWADARAVLGPDAGLLASRYQHHRRAVENDPSAAAP